MVSGGLGEETPAGRAPAAIRSGGGQQNPVTILYPYLAATAQETAFRLIARKVTAAHQVSGLDIQSSLEAAGAGDEATTSLETALALGEALYRQLTGAA